MRSLNGYVFDPYDDVGGRVLQTILPSPDQIPDFVKTAHRLTDDEIRKTADCEFALVMLDEGKKFKKYAMTDKGNTALSVMYLLKQAYLLPPEAVKVAASNLLAACVQFGLQAPDQLKIAAKGGLSPVSGKGQSPYASGAKVSKIQFPTKETPGESTENPQLGKAEDEDIAQRANMGGTPGTNFLELPSFSAKEKVKDSLGNTTKDKQASMVKTAGHFDGLFPGGIGEVRTREQTTRSTPYVDMSGWNPQTYQVEDHKPPEHTLLRGQYPVDSMDQVKVAAAYFTENWKQFHPRDRHDYCVKLASRMQDLGLGVPPHIERYGSTTYASDVDSLVSQRRGLVAEEYIPSLDMLLEKRAMVQPDTFVGALEEFDHVAGLNWVWGAACADPYATVFGPSKEKLAALEWSWSDRGVRIGINELEHLARNGKHAVKKQFGESFLDGFIKSPKTFFEALPTPNKLMLARLAMARHDGTATE